MTSEPPRVLGQHSTEHNAEHWVPAKEVQLLWPEQNRSGPYIPDEEDSPHRLWKYKGRKPQWAWNLLVWADGTVAQVPGSDLTTILSADWVFYGAHDYRIEEGSWLHQTLVSAGYTFREVPPRP